MPRPIRFAVITAGEPSLDAWTGLARRAEELGYSSLMMPDRLQTPLAIETALAVAAAVTTKLRLSSHVLVNDLRHPALVAREAATLDLLSGGRLELGIGAGVSPSDYQQLGLPFAEPGVRVGRVIEAVQLMKRLFTGESVDFAGKYYTVAGLRVMPKPVQQPHPLIFIGSGGQRMLTFAGREADIIEPAVLPGRDAPGVSLADKVGWVRAAAGDRWADLELSQSLFGVVLTDSPAAVLPTPGGPPMPRRPMTSDEAVAHIMGLHDLGFSYFSIFSGQLENFAPLVARLSGQ